MKVKIRTTHGIPLDTIQDQDILDIVIYINNQVFRIKELSDLLYLTVNTGSIIILPVSANGVFIQEKDY